MAPDKLYISQLIYDTWLYQTPDPDDDTQLEYIRKDALLEKLNRARELRIKSGQKESSDGIRVIDALTDLINKL